MKVKFIIPLLISMLIYSFALACGSETSSTTKEEFGKHEAYVAAQLEVEANLKSPSSAEFPVFEDTFVYQVDDKNFNVKAYVDSQNSFGAMVRTNFACKIEYLGNSKYKVTDLSFW